MTPDSLRKKAEEIVSEWFLNDKWRPDSNTDILVGKIEQALHQAVLEKGKRCAEIARRHIYDPTPSHRDHIVCCELHCCGEEIAREIERVK